MKNALCTCGALLLFGSSALQAADLDNLRISGFASIVGGINSDEEVNFGTNGKYGSQYDESFSMDIDSRVGLQIAAQINDDWSATMQILSRAAANYDAEVSWAYMSYQASDDAKIRVGRLRYPFYLYSDYVDVGYAYPWITPPGGAYFVGIENLDAIDVLYNFTTDSVDHQVQAYFGRSKHAVRPDEATGFETDVENTYGIIYSPSWDNVSLRMAYHRGEVTQSSPELATLNAGLEALDAALPNDLSDVVNATDPAEQDATFIGLGAKVDFDEAFVIFEYTTLQWDELALAEQRRWYLTYGQYVTDNMQIYGTYTNYNDDENSNAASDIPAGIPLGGGATSDNLIAGVNAVASAGGLDDADAYGIGLRWDASPGIALKAQYQTLDIDDGDSSELIRISIDTIF